MVNAPFGQFGRMVREARLRQDMSQQDLARLAGVNASSVSRAEAGVVRPSEETVERLAKALGLDPDRCRLAAGYAPKSANALERTLAASRRDGYETPLSPEVKKAVELILEELRRESRDKKT